MKKIIIVLLSLCMLCGCVQVTKPVVREEVEERYRGSTYVEKMKNFVCRDKNRNNTTDNPEFEEFLNNVFVEIMESDYTTLHYSVVDYRQFGIEKPPVDFGVVEYGLDTESIDYFLNQLDELHEFDFDSLSYSQQVDYEALEYSDYETLASLCYYRYNMLFTHGNTTVADLVYTLSDFTFYDQESVDDYMILVGDFDRFIEDCMTYVKAQANDGIYLLDTSIDFTQDYITDFVAKVSDNALITVFNENIDDLDFLDKSTKNELKERNSEVVTEEIIPCLKKLSDFLDKYRGSASVKNASLSKVDKEYAEFVCMLNSSTNKSADEIFETLNNVYDDMLATLNTALLKSGAVYEYLEISENDVLPTSDTAEILQWLSEQLDTIYPALEDIHFDVQQLDESSASDTITAYYWQAPIDSLDQNVIRTNPNTMDAGFDSYSTLAHEGFPGHLYQHVYYFRSEPNNFRDVISFIGYTEGWAVCAQCDATQFLDLDYEETEQLLNILGIFYHLEYSIIDIGFHYYGWSTDDISDYLKQEGIYAVFNYLYYYDEYNDNGYDVSYIREWYDEEGFYDEYAQDLLEYIVDMPGKFENYGVGYANMITLRNSVKELQGSAFDPVEYNQHILENGPLPFNILEKEVLGSY